MKKIFVLLSILCVFCVSSAYADELSSAKTTASKELDALFALYDEFDYRETEWADLVTAYNTGKLEINSAETADRAFEILNETAENMISVNHRTKVITTYISIENLVLQKGFIIFPEPVKVLKYQPVSEAINNLIESKITNVRNPLLINGTIESDFEILSVYTGLETTTDDEKEIKVPDYLYSYTGQYLTEPSDRTYLNAGDYTQDSCFVYSVNNKFPNTKASGVPVLEEDVIRVQYSVYGKGADVGANIHTSESPIINPADKSELFTLLANTVMKNDMTLLLSNESNREKFEDVLVVAEIVNISQLAVDKAKKKLLSLEPVEKTEDIPENVPEVKPEDKPDTIPEETPPPVEQPQETPDDSAKDEATPKSFTDITESHFAKEAVDYLSSKGVLSGRPDGTFGVNDNITRGEFATILARYEASEASTTLPFDDIAPDAWYANGVSFCYFAGITNGKTEDLFMPDAPITRQELATMLYRYIIYKEMRTTVETKTEFSDSQLIEIYAREAVEYLKNAGIINGRENNEFSPYAPATRGETSKMFYDIIK